MSLWKIAWRSMQQRALASALTAFSIAMGVALVVAVLVIHSVIDQSFRRGSQGYDLIVGAKGGRLQLVLNTVFHLSQPIENIPYAYCREFTEGRFVPAVQLAVPVCTGHDYKGFRAIATVPEMFEKLTYLDGRKYRFSQGRNFKSENFFEAVLGATAARETGLKLGDTFKPAGTTGGDFQHGPDQHEAFTVVGILEHTGTPNDRALFMNMEGFYRCKCHMVAPTFEERLLRKSNHGTEAAGQGAQQNAHQDQAEHPHHDHDQPISDEDKQITAILVVTNMEDNPQAAMALPGVINEEPIAQAVMPSQVIGELFDGVVGNVQLLLLVLAVLVVVVAGLGILVSIYNSMNDRRHEIAVMRALGASRLTVMAVILVESILLSLGGGALGMLLGHGLIAVLSPTIVEQTGVVVGGFQFQLVELILIPGLILLATLVGYLPAVSAYRTDVAKALTAAV